MGDESGCPSHLKIPVAMMIEISRSMQCMVGLLLLTTCLHVTCCLRDCQRIYRTYPWNFLVIFVHASTICMYILNMLVNYTMPSVFRAIMIVAFVAVCLVARGHLDTIIMLPEFRQTKALGARSILTIALMLVHAESPMNLGLHVAIGCATTILLVVGLTLDSDVRRGEDPNNPEAIAKVVDTYAISAHAVYVDL